MIHQYQNNGYNIVLDVNSGSVHVVDQEAYDVIACLEAENTFHTPDTLKSEETFAHLKEELGSKYSEDELKEKITLYFATNNCLTRRAMEQEFGLRRNAALKWLRHFTETGLLKKEGSRNSPVYFLN